MQQYNSYPENTGDGAERSSRNIASVGGADAGYNDYPAPDREPNSMLNMSSPAPLLRPPIPGSRNNSGARTPRLGLAIPPSPSAKPVGGGPTPQGLSLQMPGQTTSARPSPMGLSLQMPGQANQSRPAPSGVSLQMPGQAPLSRPATGGLSLQMPGQQPTSSRPAPPRPTRGGLSLQMPGQAPSPRPSLPRLQLATPMGSSAPPYEQSGGRPSISIATGQSASGGSESSAAHSRSGSFGPLDGRVSGPTSAGSQYSALSFASQYGLQQPQRSTPDPASAAGSLYSNYSEGGAVMERDGSMTGLEGFEDMSLESVEKGRTLDVDELDDDGWRVVCTEKRIQELGSLGEGAGGAVTRCVLKGGKMIFALKIITTTPDPDVKRQIVREIGFNKECAHEHICKYYGAFVDPSTATISIAMEFCEGGSLDSIYREVQRGKGRVGEGVLGKVAVGVLTGLSYLHTKKIMHRDIKPSNILLCRDGQVKLCDFGVSGEFGTKGDANTFIGTSYYMAPERITGQRYTITSDVWSTGVTLLEVAQNRFPFPADGTEAQPRAGLIDLLTFIVRQPVPELKDEIFYYLNKEYEENEEIIYLKKQTMTHEELELLKEDERIKEDPTISEEMKDQMMTFRVLPITRSREFKNFIAECLIKDPTERKTPWRLLASDPWMIEMKHAKVKIAKFLRQVWGWER